MAVVILKEGYVERNKIYIGTCINCSAVIQCKHDDLMFKSEPAEGQRAINMTYVRCAYCNDADVLMYEKNQAPMRNTTNRPDSFTPDFQKR